MRRKVTGMELVSDPTLMQDTTPGKQAFLLTLLTGKNADAGYSYGGTG